MFVCCDQLTTHSITHTQSIISFLPYSHFTTSPPENFIVKSIERTISCTTNSFSKQILSTIIKLNRPWLSRLVEWNLCQILCSLQSRRFLTKTRRSIDRGRHLEKQRKSSPLKLGFDSSQLSGSINVQDGRTTLFMKTSHGSRSKIRLLCRLNIMTSCCLCATKRLRHTWMSVGWRIFSLVTLRDRNVLLEITFREIKARKTKVSTRKISSTRAIT